MNEKFVLLVEDNEDDIVLTRAAFQRCQVPNELIAVYDGREALDFIFGQGKYANRDTSQIPAIVILDLKLPYISGQEVLKQIRLNNNEKIRRMPVAVLSSTTSLREITECEELGINRYYRKPGSFEQFKKIIDEIYDKWLR